MDVLISRVDNATDLPLPQYMTSGAAGMDLYANVDEDVVISVGEIRLIPAGFRIVLPVGVEAQIRPRSGLAFKHGITVLNAPGTIDSDYRGEVGVILINLGSVDFTVRRGERIAQMVVQKVEYATLVMTEDVEVTKRGSGGFGHTGA